MSGVSGVKRWRLFYGDPIYGRAWPEENEVIGHIGRSTGRTPIPLLIPTARSMGGGSISTENIVAILDYPRHFLYRHPLFHTGIWTIGQPTDPGYAVTVLHDGELHAQFKHAWQAPPYIEFMRGERFSKTASNRARTPQAVNAFAVTEALREFSSTAPIIGAATAGGAS